MRVVGGRLKGRNLASPSSREIRPTADRLRESLFNILIHAYDDPIADARVLDLFAGTGALGIEAISRGAKFALFVDNGAEARALMRNNVEALGLGGVTKVYRRDAGNLGPAHPMEPFSLVFLDPPYAKKLAERALASLRDGGWLTPAALVVVEEAKAAGFVAPEGFEELERRGFGDTGVVFFWGGGGGCPEPSPHCPPKRGHPDFAAATCIRRRSSGSASSHSAMCSARSRSSDAASVLPSSDGVSRTATAPGPKDSIASPNDASSSLRAISRSTVASSSSTISGIKRICRCTPLRASEALSFS